MRMKAAGTDGERGFALTVVLILVLGIGIGTALILPRAIRWHHAAMIQHETDCLVSDLHLMQQITRTSTVYPAEEVKDHQLYESVPELEIREPEHAYIMWRRSYAGGMSASQQILHHVYPKDIIINPNIKDKIRFGNNGGTVHATTIYVYYAQERENGKKIILDSVGRIRVEGIDENQQP